MVDDLERARCEAVGARDDERLRIQRDLHDGLGSAITAVTLKLDAAANHLTTGDHTAGRHLIREPRHDLQQTLADVRRLIYSLESDTPTHTLATSVAADAARLLGPAGIGLDVDFAAVPTLDQLVTEQLRWIIGEAVTNIARHARASRCTIIATMNDHCLRIEVTDDGCGINDAPPALGRTTMTHRAGQIHATLEHHDATPSGTTVVVTVPLIHEP